MTVDCCLFSAQTSRYSTFVISRKMEGQAVFWNWAWSFHSVVFMHDMFT